MKRLFAGVFAITLCAGLFGCGSSSDSSSNETTSQPTTAEVTEAPSATTAADNLNSEEKNIYDALVVYSSNLLNPSSLRLSDWVSGTVKRDEDFKQIYMSKGEKLEYAIISAQNKMGGNTSSYAYMHYGTLNTVNSNYSALISNLSMPSFYLENPTMLPQDSINKINVALKEYFSTIGY